jgi:hypothetical protein
LYNLKTDLGETTDLAAVEPAKTKELHEKLFSYLNDVDARFPKPDPQYDAQKERNTCARWKPNCCSSWKSSD